MTEKQYQQRLQEMSPKSPMGMDCLYAFLIGGAICLLGQIFMNLYGKILPREEAGTAASMTLVALSALLTGLSLYDNLAKYGGAGTLVPITGFANSVVSPAIEFKTEGWVTGIGAHIFGIAGPVIAYGTLASWVWGVLYWAMSKGG